MGDKHMKKSKNVREIKNNEKGSIAVLILASLLIILVVLLNLYISGSGKINSQAREINKIQEEYSVNEEEMEEEYIKATNGV